MSSSGSTERWKPVYTITPAIVRHLQSIEAARTAVQLMPLPPSVAVDLRRQARLRSTHYSTRIEGNRLTLAQAEEVIEHKVAIPRRERDVGEVRNYWNALLAVEEMADRRAPLTEEVIRKLHALVMKGKRAKPTPYRDGQNAVRDQSTNAIVYLPPEAGDVPALMAEMVAWVQRSEKDRLPAPLIAGLLHYQFVTIHPYYDGNGRTARLLATFILQRGGYGLEGLYSLEEYHARELERYYRAVATHPHHNYYEGRADVDLTGWLEYFTELLTEAFDAVRAEAVRRAAKQPAAEPAMVRRLDRRARIILGLFSRTETLSTGEMAAALGISARMARNLVNEWIATDFLVSIGAAKKTRRYGLTEEYRKYIGNE